MSEDLIMAIRLLIQGMVGIFTVQGVIALIVYLFSRLDRKE